MVYLGFLKALGVFTVTHSECLEEHDIFFKFSELVLEYHTHNYCIYSQLMKKCSIVPAQTKMVTNKNRS